MARGRLAGYPREQRLLDGLWLLCVTYPLYTGGIRWRNAAYAGNAVVGAATAYATTETAKVRPDAAKFVALLLPWIGWATLGLLTEPDGPPRV